MTSQSKQSPGRRAVQRTCVGCGQADDAACLFRVVMVPATSDPLATERNGLADDAQNAPENSGQGKERGEESPKGEFTVVFDLAGGSFGRGLYLHPSKSCFARACRSGFSKAMKRSVRVEPSELEARLRTAGERRVMGMLAAARRGRFALAGTDVALDALRSGAPLLVVAADAGGVARKAEVTAAVAEGRAIAFGVKASLGALFAREEVALMAITQASVAAEVKRLVSMVDAAGGRHGGSLEV